MALRSIKGKILGQLDLVSNSIRKIDSLIYNNVADERGRYVE